jgi:hypothetical protein
MRGIEVGEDEREYDDSDDEREGSLGQEDDKPGNRQTPVISNSENLTHQFSNRQIHSLDRDRGCNPCVINHFNTASVTSSLACAMIQCPLSGSSISSSFGMASLILCSTFPVVAVGSFPPQMCSTGSVAGR